MRRAIRVWLWVVAIVMTLVPRVVFFLLGPRTYVTGAAWFGPVTCPAFEFEPYVYSIPGLYEALDWAEIVVPAAFGAWLFARGRRFGRVAGLSAAGYVLLPQLIDPVFILFDLAVGGGMCWSLWSQEISPDLWWWFAYYSIVAVLIVTAVRVPARRPRRLRRTRRALAAGVAVCVTLALVSSAQPPVPARRSAQLPVPGHKRVEADGCAPWTSDHLSYAETRPEDRERAFVCEGRAAGGLLPKLSRMPAAQMISYGRELCGVTHLDATRPRARRLLKGAGERRGWSFPLMRALVFLCPEGVRRWWPGLVVPMDDSGQGEEEWLAELASHCRDPLRSPRARRSGTTAVLTSEAVGYVVAASDDDVGKVVDLGIDKVISAEGASAYVRTRVQNSAICVTVKAFTRRPSISLRHWDRVVETGIDSPTGRLFVTGSDSDARLPNLAASGRGHYMIRVYVRNQDKAEESVTELPVEEHLIVVYPGRSTRTRILKK
jgi:hypothetical protein